MQEKLKQAKHLAEMYREQCVALESELAQIREENNAGRELFKVPAAADGCACERLSFNFCPKYCLKCVRVQERSDKMAKRLQLMTKRYEALEKRRAMEAEGFKTDLRLLKDKFKDVERKLFKVQKTSVFGCQFWQKNIHTNSIRNIFDTQIVQTGNIDGYI